MHTQDELKTLFDYDPDGDLIRLLPTKWKYKAGTKLSVGIKPLRSGYIYVWAFGVKEYVHRLVFLWHHGYIPKYIDHINRVKGDNRIENLRECTAAQNSANIAGRPNGTSTYKGVSSGGSSTHPWQVHLSVQGKRIYIGNFITEDAAALAYNKATIEKSGDFAYINQVGNAEIVIKKEKSLADELLNKKETPYRGVTRNGKGWKAVIGHRTKNIHIGTYKTQKEAAHAYNKRAIQLHGERAFLNEL